MLRGYSILALSFAVSGCAAVATYPAPLDQRAGGPPQSAGTYYLPKQLVQVQVITTQTNVASDPARLISTRVLATQVITVPDERLPFQLGFELSPLSDDNIDVTYENGMLKAINAVATDRTGDIFVAIAKDVGLLRDAPNITATFTRTLQFDPFDPVQARRVNAQLGAGSCIEVELRPGVWSPGCPAGLSMSGSRVRPVQIEEGGVVAGAPPPPTAGVYFRRAMPKTVHAVLDGRTYETRQLLFANDAPIYRIEIDRSLFVTRETHLTFASGELVSVSVKKDSEALAAAKLPAAIVAAYISSVTDSLTQRAGVENARANYYNAQAAAIKANLSLQQAIGASAASGIPAAFRAGAGQVPTLRDAPAEVPGAVGSSQEGLARCRNLADPFCL